jgi:hypothetical protein
MLKKLNIYRLRISLTVNVLHHFQTYLINSINFKNNSRTNLVVSNATSASMKCLFSLGKFFFFSFREILLLEILDVYLDEHCDKTTFFYIYS